MTRRAVVEQVMGLPVSLHLDGPQAQSPATLQAVADVFALLHEADARFTTYRDDSEVMRLRDGRLDLADASPDVHEVLRLCDLARERTGGLFDAYLPGADGRRVLDPSGLVKGWAAERAAAHLARLPGFDHYLNVGGDITGRVGVTGSPPWRVAVEDPAGGTAFLAILDLRSGAVATSGSAARGPHIVDPHTGVRPSGLLAVTVTGPTLLWADVFATAAFARGGEDVAGWVAKRAPDYRVAALARAP